MVFGLGVNVQKNAYADSIDSVTATLAVSCTMEGVVDAPHTTGDLMNGTAISDIGTTSIMASCNDAGGYSVQAIGFSNDTEGNTSMLDGGDGSYNIATGTATTGSTSNWAMKVTPVSGVSSMNGFDSYSAVPASYTKVLQKSSGVEPGSAVQATTTYQIFASGSQPAGTYVGKVKYTLVHPSTQSCPDGYELDGGVCKAPVFGGITTMQEMTPTICSAAAENDTKQLKDTRDNTTYTVTKLSDGNCWMLDNLALDLTDSTVQSKLTNSTTNASDTTLGYLKNGGGSSPYTNYAVAAVTSSNYYDRPAINTGSINVIPTDSLSTAGGWKVGVYYNYCAASAGSYCYSSSSSSGNASEDICPKGWRMPTGGSSGEYQALYTAYSSDYTNFRNALSLPLSGYFYSGQADRQGSNGYFWSSTRYNNTRMYNLVAYTSDIHPASITDRTYGYSVRCIAGS